MEIESLFWFHFHFRKFHTTGLSRDLIPISSSLEILFVVDFRFRIPALIFCFSIRLTIPWVQL